MTSVLALKTIKSNDCCFSGGLKWNVFNRLPSLHTCCTDPAADQGAWRRSRSPGMTEPPFLRHPFVVPTPSSLPMDDPATSRGQLCRRSPPPLLHPRPSVRSRSVNQRLFHRGNPALPGVSAQPGTICPRALTQEQHCQGGFPLTCCTLQTIWARPGTGDRSIMPESGHSRADSVCIHCKATLNERIQGTS